MTSTVFGILSDPAIGERLHTELRAAFPDPNEELSFLKLEAMPYLVRTPMAVEEMHAYNPRAPLSKKGCVKTPGLLPVCLD